MATNSEEREQEQALQKFIDEEKVSSIDSPKPEGKERLSNSVGTDSSKKYAKDFTFGNVIGEGAYGAVVLGKENDTGREFAIKILEKSHLIKEKKVKYATTERDILTKCSDHPNIVKLYYTFKDDERLFYVLEYCSNGELLKQLNKFGSFDETCAVFYTAELINALEYLHELGIIHRDLKPENVLLDEDMHLKLTDFGTSKIIGNEKNARSNSFVGTAEYVSPELLNDKVTYKSSDLWALGCIIYQMIAGRPPFRGASEFMTFQAVSSGVFTYPKGFPEVPKDLINQLLVMDPERRIGADTYKDLKNHAFFKGVNFETLHMQTPPPLKPYPTKLVFEDDISAKKMPEPDSEKWKKFLLDEEVILESGLVWKRKGRSVKKRQLILTSKPRIIYIDTKKMVQRGEVPWSQNLRPEAKNNTAWFIHTPKRTYILEDIPGKAQRWVDAINKVLETTKK
eukprot:TRINITY_DN6173_c0_g1_i1.p1 TRINITY_DN6173_c0_g1~~TRINITY_DN6173_c0_g1_i1.p1  ORF type:complete len:454 (+),score=114.06 TRINITY_DN6173_c0_g1_i1:181-1542(+)